MISKSQEARRRQYLVPNYFPKAVYCTFIVLRSDLDTRLDRVEPAPPSVLLASRTGNYGTHVQQRPIQLVEHFNLDNEYEAYFS